MIEKQLQRPEVPCAAGRGRPYLSCGTNALAVHEIPGKRHRQSRVL